MTSFDYNYQNPSVCCFLVQITAIVLLSSAGLTNLNNKAKPKWILVVVVKYRHRAIVLFVYSRSTKEFIRTRRNVSVRSRSNWNLKVSAFKEKGKPEYPDKNLSEQRGESTTNSTHIRRRRQDSNPGHICGRRVLSPLRHPCSNTYIVYR